MTSPATASLAVVTLLAVTTVTSLPEGLNLQRIYHGWDAAPGTRRYMVSLWTRGQHICGGALIGPEFVLTAAHCVDEISDKKDLTIIVAEVDLSQWETTAISVDVDTIVIHSEWNRRRIRNDIALLKLTKPLDGERIAYATLAKNESFTNTTCLFMGWGITDPESNSAQQVLQEAHLDMLTWEECHKLMGDEIWSQHKQICALDLTPDPVKGHKSTCVGDSGGPMMCGQDFRFLTGITSYGTGRCDPLGSPGVYTRVSAYLDWVEWNQFILTMRPISSKCNSQ